jgi:uncharacterized lipoprotein YbaY
MAQQNPILPVVDYEEDGSWASLEGGTFLEKDATLVTLESVVRVDLSVVELADLPLGWLAERTAASAPWSRRVNNAI